MTMPVSAPLVPLSMLAGAVLIPVARRSLSHFQIDGDALVVDNFPGRMHRIPLADVDRFDSVASARSRAQMRRVKAVVVLTNGSTVPVLALGNPETAGSTTALNNWLEALRRRAEEPSPVRPLWYAPRSARAVSSGGEHFLDTEGVTSSNLVRPTRKRRSAGVKHPG